MMHIASFAECNQRLLNRDILVDISEYILLAQSISINLASPYETLEINGIIHFMAGIAHENPYAFSIPVSQVERLGFFIKDTFRNRIRQILLQTSRNSLENDLAFLKRNKLKSGIDYELNTNYLSTIGDVVDIEYRINFIAFYKLLTRKYHNSFLFHMNIRTLQIVDSYQLYVSAFYQKQAANMQRTIDGLNADIHTLINEYPQIIASSVFRKAYHTKPNSISCSSCGDHYDQTDEVIGSRISFDQSYSNGSIEYRDESSSESESNGSHAPILQDESDAGLIISDELWKSDSTHISSPVLLESPHFTDEVAAIHSTLFNIVGSPHESLDILNYDWTDPDGSESSSRTSRCGSIGENPVETNHVRALRYRFITYLNTSPTHSAKSKRRAAIRRSAH